MEQARIAIFEDDDSNRIFMARMLPLLGHQVVAELATIEQAREFIQDLGEDVIDVAIVDGNLDSGSLDSSDGAEITGLLKYRASSVTVIGHSGSNDIEGADINVTKGDPSRLLDAIKAI